MWGSSICAWICKIFDLTAEVYFNFYINTQRIYFKLKCAPADIHP